jgi:aryl-alcohol dehydrogenase-like predicted oxidoreductase
VLAQPGVTAAIVGAHRASQIDGWIAAGSLVLGDDDLAELDRAVVETGAGRG